jgi:copper chaperone CopZ
MKSSFKILTASLTLALSFSAYADCVETEKSAHAESPLKNLSVAQASSSNTASFKVSKMSCGKCAAKIRKALETDLGLKDVDVDLTTKTVKVLCPTGACAVEKISQSIAGAGYPVDSSL